MTTFSTPAWDVLKAADERRLLLLPITARDDVTFTARDDATFVCDLAFDHTVIDPVRSENLWVIPFGESAIKITVCGRFASAHGAKSSI